MDQIKKGAGALFISPKTNRALLSLRATHKTHMLTWSLFGGMFKDNEQPKDCLLREITEEIGFLPDINRIYPFDIFQSKDKKFMYYTFVCVVDQEFIPKLNEESSGYSWCELGIWPGKMHQGTKTSFGNEKSLEKLRIICAQHLP